MATAGPRRKTGKTTTTTKKESTEDLVFSPDDELWIVRTPTGSYLLDPAEEAPAAVLAERSPALLQSLRLLVGECQNGTEKKLDCQKCKKKKERELFHPGDWEHIRRTYNGVKCRLCIACLSELKTEKVKFCGNCNLEKTREEFYISDWEKLKRTGDDGEPCRFCAACVDKG